MPDKPTLAIVAGHTCLDIHPNLDAQTEPFGDLLVPGNLVIAGPAVISTGGAVSNTGLALHRLGFGVNLMGKIGRDLFGQAILEILRRRDPALADGMIVSDDPSSYTIVITPPGVDRIFLHCPGANDTFGADDVDYDKLSGARLFHFGYPPIMKRIYQEGGRELVSLLERVKKASLTTSLDMSVVDPASEAGQVDWAALLVRTLPHVDVFLPSIDEILFMLDRRRFDHMQSIAAGGNIMSQVNGAVLAEVSQQLIEMGAAIVVLKLGDKGLYLRTTSDAERLAAAGACTPPDARDWTGRELFSTCFEVELTGAAGAGDCTIAGFLAAMLHELGPEKAMTAAVAAGACNVEAHDTISGVVHWSELQSRIDAGWKRCDVGLSLSGWRTADDDGVLHGPHDAKV